MCVIKNDVLHDIEIKREGFHRKSRDYFRHP